MIGVLTATSAMQSATALAAAIISGASAVACTLSRVSLVSSEDALLRPPVELESSICSF